MPDNVIPTSRLEAFSDAVIAIVITIMVIEMKKPPGYDLSDLAPVIPIFLSYIMSFTYLGIFWSNHHHLMHVAKQANARTMWANLHWLFWMSLIPFTTSWLGHNHGRPWPTILYGCVLLMVGLGYMIL